MTEIKFYSYSNTLVSFKCPESFVQGVIQELLTRGIKCVFVGKGAQQFRVYPPQWKRKIDPFFFDEEGNRHFGISIKAHHAGRQFFPS